MVIEVHVEGLDNYKKAADEHKGKVIFALFSGSTDSEGNNWCPDCVAGKKKWIKGDNLAILSLFTILNSALSK